MNSFLASGAFNVDQVRIGCLFDSFNSVVIRKVRRQLGYTNLFCSYASWYAANNRDSNIAYVVPSTDMCYIIQSKISNILSKLNLEFKFDSFSKCFFIPSLDSRIFITTPSSTSRILGVGFLNVSILDEIFCNTRDVSKCVAISNLTNLSKRVIFCYDDIELPDIFRYYLKDYLKSPYIHIK